MSKFVAMNFYRWLASLPKPIQYGVRGVVLLLWLGIVYAIWGTRADFVAIVALTAGMATFFTVASHLSGQGQEMRRAEAENREPDLGEVNRHVVVLSFVLLGAGMATMFAAVLRDYEYPYSRVLVVVPLLPGTLLYALAKSRSPLVRYWFKPRPPR